MKITTWNILAPMWTKSKDYLTNPINVLSKNRRPHILQVLQELNSDVFLLQEVQKSELEYIKDALPNYVCFFGAHKKKLWKRFANHYEKNGNAILIKKNLFNKFYVKELVLSKNGNVALMILVDNIILVSVHLDSILKNLRNFQLKNLITFLQKFPTYQIFIGGDYNDDLHEYIKNIDPHYKVDHNLITYMEKDDTCSCDHIYYKNAHLVKNSTPQIKYSKTIEEYGSDHIPVTLYFSVS